MSIENIRIAKGAISDRIYAGYLSRDQQTWLKKHDVTNDFLAAAIARWKGYKEIIASSDGKRYEIAVREIG